MRTILLLSPYWKEEHRWMVSTVKLSELWQKLGYRVVVLCMGKARSGKREAGSKITVEQCSNTLTIYRVPDFFIPDPWNYGIAFGFSGYAVRLAREIKPDIIVVNKVLFWSSIALLRLRFAGFRVLLLTDALVGITWWPRGKIAQVCSAIYAWTLGWMILKASTKIVFFHPQPSATLNRLGVADKSIVIPTGIDSTSFKRIAVSDEARNLTASRLPLIATYIGRLESVKGVDDFVVAGVKVKKDHAELTVRVVGWYKNGHELVKKYNDQVNFTGLRHDISEILAETDIFVLPSYSEGLSNALMEAMASGCACIASDVGGNRFLIQNGVSGFLFPAGDRDALASHIRRLVEDSVKRKALGENARKRIDDVFSWEKVGKQYADLFTRWIADAGQTTRANSASI